MTLFVRLVEDRVSLKRLKRIKELKTVLSSKTTEELVILAVSFAMTNYDQFAEFVDK